jgi:hypothetical protein
MTDRAHHLEFVVEAGHWDTAERYAANRIRTYTRENKRGPDSRTNDEVLRSAEFSAIPVDGNTTLWRITVKVTI